jgi:hypothetical protein
MARIRTIKPEFWTSEKIAHLSRDARLTFIGMWNESDDYGVVTANTRLLKGHLWALDDDISPTDVALHIQQMVDQGLVARFDAEDKPWLHIVGFNEHQKISRPSEKRNPAPPDEESVQVTSTPPSDSRRAHGGLNEPAVLDRERERDRERENSVDEFDEQEPPPPSLHPVPPTAKRPDPHRPQAEAVLKDWWERQTPRPQTPWVAAVKILTNALRSGYTTDDIGDFLESTTVISGAALDRWQRERSRPAKPRRAMPTTEGALRALGVSQ